MRFTAPGHFPENEHAQASLVFSLNCCHMARCENQTIPWAWWTRATALALLALLAAAGNGGPGGGGQPDFTHPPPHGPCNVTALIEVYEAQLARIALLRTNVTDKNDLMARQTQLWDFEKQPAWQNCLILVASEFAIWGNTSRTLRQSKECREEYNSTAWRADPCCNRVLEVTEACCAPRDLHVEVVDVVDLNQTALEGRCGDPVRAGLVLHDLMARMEDEDRCHAHAGGAGDMDLWDSLNDFRQTCQNEVFGEDGVPPACRTSADCWSADCDTQQLTCNIPWQNPFAALVSCYVATMDAEMYKRVLDVWGVGYDLDETAFRIEFMERLSAEDCVGPRAWEYAGHWTSRPCTEEEAAEDERCRCWSNQFAGTKGAATASGGGDGGPAVRRKRSWQALFDQPQGNETDGGGGGGGSLQCWWQGYIEGNETGCLSVEGCNWQPWLTNETECMADSDTAPAVCAQCWGDNNCVKMGDASECRTYGQSPEQCSAAGGTYHDDNGWTRCVFEDLATMEECVPEAVCPWVWQQYRDPNVPKNLFGADYWCSQRCYAPAATTSEDCAALNGQAGSAACVSMGYASGTDCGTAVGSENVASYDDGTHVCLLVLDQTACQALGDYVPDPVPLGPGETYSLWRLPPTANTWFDTAAGVCNVNFWQQSDCEGAGFTFTAAHVWHQGFLSTQEECEQGYCDVNPGLNETQCAATGYCNRGCPACRSRSVGQGQGVCFVGGDCPVDSNSGLTVGTYKSGPDACVFDARSEPECTALSAQLDNNEVTFQQCESLSADIEACSACELGTGDCSLRQDLLRCFASPYDRCDDEESCSQAGDCTGTLCTLYFKGFRFAQRLYIPMQHPHSGGVTQPGDKPQCRRISL